MPFIRFVDMARLKKIKSDLLQSIKKVVVTMEA